MLNTKVTPKEAEAERRTAANALGQSYCMLTTRAGIEVNQEIRNSEYCRFISPCAQIHDAQYFLLKDDIDIFIWLHEKLLHAVEWQEDPAIAHPLVHLGGELSLFWPSWANEISIPNHSSKEETMDIIKQSVEEYRKSH